MPPASAQPTLTPAQGQKQAAKAEIKSTGDKLYQDCLPAKNMLTFFVCFRESIVYLFVFFIHITFWLWWVHSAKHSGRSFFWMQDRANSH